ncbi:MAG TPA: discoidin domain-containing protein [Anaerolineales bacterium]|nr:discoidin domain-containing protein [Anaerolineales bacterium]
MKSTPSPQDEEIIELLKRLGTLKAEYPAELLAARRAAFTAQIEQRQANGAKIEEYYSQEEVIELLEELKPAVAEYPTALLSARRAAFIAQVEQRNNGHVQQELPSQDPVIELLGNMKSAPVEYPPALLSARRAAFIAQIRQHNEEQVQEEASAPDPVIELLRSLRAVPAEYPPALLSARRTAFIAQVEQHNRETALSGLQPSHNGSLFTFFDRLKSIEIEYPLKLWSARRTGFVNQIRDSRVSVLEALHSVFRNMFDRKGRHSEPPAFRFGRTSMILATFLVVAFVSFLAYGNRQPIKEAIGSAFLGQGGSGPSPVAAVTSTGEVAKIICKPGYLPPLCLAQEFDQTQDLTFPGNGSARPAVAKDTIPGHSRIHKAAYVNDGLYGPGASWISNSAYSWIKIDLGDVRTINTVTFGRDRLGNLNDGDPGQFVIAVAISDNVYRDGNSSNDFLEYRQVYDSEKAGFDGIISGPETIEARFDPVETRYVKITFENAGTAVDEIEAFMLQPHGFVSNPTQRPRDTLVPASFTPVPTNTLVPSKTPTLIPTNTFMPTRTPTLIPTNTPVPSNTPSPTDTSTPRPTHTDPPPTHTPEPPTDTPEPPPTDTPEPPTDTPEPPPADTPEPPPSATVESLFSITETPEVFVP